MKERNPFLKFYEVYNVDYWYYKLSLLKNYLDDYDTVGEFLQKDVGEVDQRHYVNMLKAEMHFTYFQMIESLFEMTFALQKKDDPNLWYHLTFSDWKDNYERIREVSQRKIGFLRDKVKLSESVTVPLAQYIFYFLYPTGLTPEAMKQNVDVIINALIQFAKVFSDRKDYNAYKHSLR